MPARKPASLIRRHETAAERAERETAEESLQPGRLLPVQAPARLKNHKEAAAVWREVMRTYNQLDRPLVTRLDLHILVDYCLLMEELGELLEMRRVAYRCWLDLAQEHKRLLEADEVAEAVIMAVKVVGAFDAVVKLDGRADRKRDLLDKLRKSMYLTPRSKAGAQPAGKKRDPLADDPMAQLLGEVTDFVNGGGDEE